MDLEFIECTINKKNCFYKNADVFENGKTKTCSIKLFAMQTKSDKLNDMMIQSRE